MFDVDITIIGAGAYGTALATILSKHDRKILLFGSSKRIKSLHDQGFFSRNLLLETSMTCALLASRNILVAVPSHAFRILLTKIKLLIRPDTRLVWATKGLEFKTGRLLKNVAEEILGHHLPLAVISGPSFANELQIGLPTAISLVSNNAEFSTFLKKILRCKKSLYVYETSDFIGIQIASTIKNIIALGVGMLDGIGFGANSRVVLITRGLEEMMKFGVTLGAEKKTFMEISGLGDLILTCTDNQSRNRRFGVLIGQGMHLKDAQKKIGQVIEGYYNTQDIIKMAYNLNIRMPITEEIYLVLHHKKNIKEAALKILSHCFERL